MRSKILISFLQVTDMHASIWLNGVVCGTRNSSGGSTTLLAQFDTFLKLKKESSLKIVVVSKTRKLAAKHMHIFTRTLETLLNTYYSTIEFEAFATGDLINLKIFYTFLTLFYY